MLNEGLNGTLNGTLDYIRNNPGCQANHISIGLKRPIDTIKKHIMKLTDKGLIEKRGSRKTGGYYVIS